MKTPFETVGENKGETTMNIHVAVRLLLTAAVLMLLAGCLFGFAQQWICAALVWVGAFGCLMAALNFRNRKGE